jgi:precorrin-6B methylase 2
MDEYDKALEILKANCEAFGVSTANVSDGQVFMFSKEFIWDLVKQLNDSDKNHVLIFVQKSKPIPRESMS